MGHEICSAATHSVYDTTGICPVSHRFHTLQRKISWLYGFVLIVDQNTWFWPSPVWMGILRRRIFYPSSTSHFFQSRFCLKGTKNWCTPFPQRARSPTKQQLRYFMVLTIICGRNVWARHAGRQFLWPFKSCWRNDNLSTGQLFRLVWLYRTAPTHAVPEIILLQQFPVSTDYKPQSLCRSTGILGVLLSPSGLFDS